MTSECKKRSNRANARASTGPRTAAGKARAASNARRHGLSVSVLLDSTQAAELDGCARVITGESANPELQALASRVAAAQIDLVRVRRARHLLMSRALNDPNDGESTAILLADVAQKLITFDRYERRALSRRKFAIRAFDAARACVTCGTES